jgi:hypothetical protein
VDNKRVDKGYVVGSVVIVNACTWGLEFSRQVEKKRYWVASLEVLIEGLAEATCV